MIFCYAPWLLSNYIFERRTKEMSSIYDGTLHDYTPAEVAKIMNVSQVTICQWIKIGKVKAVNISKSDNRARWIIKPEEVDRLRHLRDDRDKKISKVRKEEPTDALTPSPKAVAHAIDNFMAGYGDGLTVQIPPKKPAAPAVETPVRSAAKEFLNAAYGTVAQERRDYKKILKEFRDFKSDLLAMAIRMEELEKELERRAGLWEDEEH